MQNSPEALEDPETMYKSWLLGPALVFRYLGITFLHQRMPIHQPRIEPQGGTAQEYELTVQGRVALSFI